MRVAPDTLQLTFHLRRDVYWHDGAQTTADDVLFTFDRVIDPRTAAPHSEQFRLYRPRAERLDSFTVSRASCARFRLAADAREAVGEEAAAEVGAEIVLDPLRMPSPSKSAVVASARKVSTWCWTKG